MTQHEFETRVKMEVSSKEYEAIEAVYMNSDLDKDEFCKMWVKMNKSRVAKAEAERKAREQREADIETAFELYNKLGTVSFNDVIEGKVSRLAVAHLTAKEQTFAERIGIAMMEWSWNYGMELFRDWMSVRYDLGVFCGATKARA